jgi:hypothetical protein
VRARQALHLMPQLPRELDTAAVDRQLRRLQSLGGPGITGVHGGVALCGFIVCCLERSGRDRHQRAVVHGEGPCDEALQVAHLLRGDSQPDHALPAENILRLRRIQAGHHNEGGPRPERCNHGAGILVKQIASIAKAEQQIP